MLLRVLSNSCLLSGSISLFLGYYVNIFQSPSFAKNKNI